LIYLEFMGAPLLMQEPSAIFLSRISASSGSEVMHAVCAFRFNTYLAFDSNWAKCSSSEVSSMQVMDFHNTQRTIFTALKTVAFGVVACTPMLSGHPDLLRKC